jgi:hypothetical protein
MEAFYGMSQNVKHDRDWPQIQGVKRAYGRTYRRTYRQAYGQV